MPRMNLDCTIVSITAREFTNDDKTVRHVQALEVEFVETQTFYLDPGDPRIPSFKESIGKTVKLPVTASKSGQLRLA